MTDIQAAFKAGEKTLKYVTADTFDKIIKDFYGREYHVIGVVEDYNGTYHEVDARYGCEDSEIQDAFELWDKPFDGFFRRESEWQPRPYVLIQDMVNKGLLPDDFSIAIHIYW